MEAQYRFPYTIFFPHTIVAKGLSQICPQDKTKMLGSTDSNSREWPQNFLCFSLTYYFSSEHKPLFIPIGLYFIKRHVWRVRMFHKTIHNAWNLFNLSNSHQKILQKIMFHDFRSVENYFWLIFDWSSALFDRSNRNETAIETSRDSMIFSLPFQSIEPKLHQ